jgi:hypothetical protein
MFEHVERWLMVVAVVVVCTLIYGFATPSFRYRTVSFHDVHFEFEMNSLGELGWDAVDCRRAYVERLFQKEGDGDYQYECILKRPAYWWDDMAR